MKSLLLFGALVRSGPAGGRLLGAAGAVRLVAGAVSGRHARRVHPCRHRSWHAHDGRSRQPEDEAGVSDRVQPQPARPDLVAGRLAARVLAWRCPLGQQCHGHGEAPVRRADESIRSGLAAELDAARLPDDPRLAEHRPLGRRRALGEKRDRPGGLVARRQRDRLSARQRHLRRERARRRDPGRIDRRIPARRRGRRTARRSRTAPAKACTRFPPTPRPRRSSLRAGSARSASRAGASDGARLAAAYLRGVAVVSLPGGQAAKIAGASGPDATYLPDSSTLLVTGSAKGCGGRAGIAELIGGKLHQLTNCAAAPK